MSGNYDSKENFYLIHDEQRIHVIPEWINKFERQKQERTIKPKVDSFSVFLRSRIDIKTATFSSVVPSFFTKLLHSTSCVKQY